MPVTTPASDCEGPEPNTSQSVWNVFAGRAMKLMLLAPVAKKLMPAAHQTICRPPRKKSAPERRRRMHHQPIPRLTAK